MDEEPLVRREKIVTLKLHLPLPTQPGTYLTECSSSLFRFRAPGRLKSIDGNAFLIRLPSSRIARSSGVSGVRSNQPSMVPDWKDHQSMMARQSRWRLLSLIVARVASRGEQGTIPRRGETGYSLAISDNGSIKNRFRGGRSASMFVAVPTCRASTTTPSTGSALVAAR